MVAVVISCPSLESGRRGMRRAGIDSFIIKAFAPEGGVPDETVERFGADVWPAAREAA